MLHYAVYFHFQSETGYSEKKFLIEWRSEHFTRQFQYQCGTVCFLNYVKIYHCCLPLFMGLIV